MKAAIGSIKKCLKLLITPAKLLVVALLLTAVIFGNKFREYNYATVPFPGENADEYSFGWLGLSLIENHYPIAWSGIGGYKTTDFQKINVDKVFDIQPNRPAFPIDKPWFDHPPLMGLLVGGYAYLHGVRSFVDASVIVLRRPMLKIAILDIILVFILASQLFGKRIGVISALLYSLIPTIVISSRLALAENGYIPLFLASLIFAFEFFKRKKKSLWLTASILASISVLFKLSGISVPLALVFIALVFGGKDRWRQVLYPAIGAMLALGLFALYGAYFDWSTFVSVMSANANRFFGASSEIFYSVISNPKIVNTKNYTDGWITAGLISFFIVAFSGWAKDKNIKFLSIAFFSYLFVFLLFGSEPYGNYRFPFYPFIVISLSYVISKLWDKPNIALMIMLALLPIGTEIHRIIGVVGFQKLVPYFRLGVILALGVFGIGLISNKKTVLIIQRLFLIAVGVLLVYWAVREIYFVNVDTWYFIT